MAARSDTVTKSRTCKTELPTCPDCGALECLCRPRFFAGQLLTEQDLNLLDQYAKKKHRLQNRNLHGWGVVNGLLVLCDPCGDVKVTEGYAINPCGDDIVVCQETAVNICELIRKCKQAERQDVACKPFHRPPNTNCDDLEEEWVLAIKYKEWPSRGITALRGNTCKTCNNCGTAPCTCGTSNAACGCGKGPACDCTTPGTSGIKSRTAPPECEPTITCEGYCFEVYPKPEQDDRGRNDKEDDERLFPLDGAVWDAFNCCAEPLVAAIPPMPDLREDDSFDGSMREIANWCCRSRNNLLNYFLTHRNTSCEIIDFLKAIVCPNPGNPSTYEMDFTISFYSLLAAWAEGLKNCLCLALLPPAPSATHDTRVPLATIKLRAHDCEILSVCNWTIERKIMVTWPTIGHWSGVFSIGQFFHCLIDNFCCNSLLGVFDDFLDRIKQDDSQGSASVASNLTNNNNAENLSFAQSLSMASTVFSSQVGSRLRINNFGKFIADIIERGDQPLELGAALNSVSPRFRLPTEKGELSSVEAKNLPLLLLTEVLAKPVIKSFTEEFGKGFQSRTGQKVSSAGDVDKMQTQLNTMQAQLNKQNKEIKAMRSRIDSGK